MPGFSFWAGSVKQRTSSPRLQGAASVVVLIFGE
ncbi:hypothetical protein EV184_12194, partial [Sinorhizobium americanum]